jgi:hypothetical protein
MKSSSLASRHLRREGGCLPNLEHFEKAEDFLYPLMVHKLARYLDQIGEDPVASDNDKKQRRRDVDLDGTECSQPPVAHP